MRISCKTLLVAGIAASLALFGGRTLLAEDEEDDDDDAASAKIAKDALDKSIARGAELFKSKDLGKKSCAKCHENPEKPNLNLANRSFTYPQYSRKKKGVVTLGQKINEMLSGKSGGKEMDLASADLVALEAYVVSVRKK